MRNRKSKSLCSLQIDRERKLLRLYQREFGRFRASEDFIDIGCDMTPHRFGIWTIVDQAADFCKRSPIRDCRQAMLDCEIGNSAAVAESVDEDRLNDESARPLSDHRHEDSFELLRPLDYQLLDVDSELLAAGDRFVQEYAMCRIAPVSEEGHTRETRHDLAEELQPLHRQLRRHH